VATEGALGVGARSMPVLERGDVVPQPEIVIAMAITIAG
jgi:hypothetical protein